jgi:hypothetical protein
MSDLHDAFVSKSFLRSHWDLEYRAWQDSDNEKALDVRLALWAKRTDLKETSAESAFIDVFFRETWGYVQTGQRGSETGFSLYPKFAIPVQVQTAAVAKPILLSATSARQRRARFRTSSASLRGFAAPWMPTKSGRETPDRRCANVSTI